jgi:hypothetical protein
MFRSVNETLNNTEIALTLGNDYGTGTYKYFILGKITKLKYLKNINKFNIITVTNEDTRSAATTDDGSESSFPHLILVLMSVGLLVSVVLLTIVFRGRYLNRLKCGICGSDSNDGANDKNRGVPLVESNVSNNRTSTTNKPPSA